MQQQMAMHKNMDIFTKIQENCWEPPYVQAVNTSSSTSKVSDEFLPQGTTYRYLHFWFSLLLLLQIIVHCGTPEGRIPTMMLHYWGQRHFGKTRSPSKKQGFCFLADIDYGLLKLCYAQLFSLRVKHWNTI